MYDRFQTTLRRPVSLSGVGLHSGCRSTITLRPAAPDTGILWRRIDLPGCPVIEAVPHNVVNTQRCTVIGAGGAVVRTVEHVMSALRGLGVDNCVIDIDQEEPPVGDGSAAVFVAMIQEAGLQEQPVPRVRRTLTEPVFVQEGASHIIALPHDRLSIACVFANDHGHPAFSHQFAEFDIEPECYAQEVAPARTMGFLHEIEALRKQGLALGGDMETAVVIGQDRILTPMRYADEFVRHKILDLVGDLALLGHFTARVVAIRPSHRVNTLLTRQIAERLGWVPGLAKTH